MDHGVTVLAGSAHRKVTIRSGCFPVADRVALEAQPRARHFQRELVDRAMRIVTVQAILAHRRMLEQERSALFGVAGVAIVVDRILPQQSLGGAAVRIMTIRAHDLALAHRHV